jgi:hypothetical protein
MALTAISVLGVDLGKNVCSVVGLDASGAVVLRRKVRRETLIALVARQSGWEGSDNQDGHFGGRSVVMIATARR